MFVATIVACSLKLLSFLRCSRGVAGRWIADPCTLVERAPRTNTHTRAVLYVKKSSLSRVKMMRGVGDRMVRNKRQKCDGFSFVVVSTMMYKKRKRKSPYSRKQTAPPHPCLPSLT